VSNGHVWRTAQERLRQQMSRAQFDTWLRGTWLAPSEGEETILCVRSTFARELLQTRYRERIEAAIAEVTGRPCRLRVVVATTPAAEEADASPASVVVPVRSVSSRVGASRDAHAVSADRPTLFGAADVPDTEAPEPRRAPLAAGEIPTRRTVALSAGRKRPPGTGAGLARSERVRTALERARADAAGASAQPVSGTRLAGDGGSENTAAGDVSSSHHRRDEIDGSANMSGQGRIRDARDAREAHGEDPGEPSGESRDGARRQLPLESPAPELTPAGASSAFGGPTATASRLNPRYTFSTFIVGSGNQLAHAASQAVAEAPGFAYNPLFLYGGVGLGKTHLLHAIGHTALASDLVVLYVSSETFTNDIVNAIRYRTTEEFRAKYRSVDVLLVDDIQFIAGKDSTEEEFFHTFNALHEANKQIVICSDRPPKAIVSLEERLRSRFEWGLIADIQPPDLETRVAILRAKSDMIGRHVPDEVISFLASRVQSNIRELEGSFNRLLAFSQLQGLPLTIDTAKAALANLATDGRQRRVSVTEVLEAVAEFYRISLDDLCGKQRDKHIVVPRQVAMYLMRQETDASLLEIGQALGGRDHSTVLHGCDKIGREVNENTALRKEVLAIRQQLFG
jgi:chromosomal replication initiator protein DnaA